MVKGGVAVIDYPTSFRGGMHPFILENYRRIRLELLHRGLKQLFGLALLVPLHEFCNFVDVRVLLNRDAEQLNGRQCCGLAFNSEAIALLGLDLGLIADAYSVLFHHATPFRSTVGDGLTVCSSATPATSSRIYPAPPVERGARKYLKSRMWCRKVSMCWS